MPKSHMLVFLLVAVSIILSACTPAYTADTTGRYVRKIAISSQYEIRRRHSRAISRDNRISIVVSTNTVVVANAETQQPTNTLAREFYHGFSSYFPALHCATSPVPSIALAGAIAEKNRSNFLFYIDVISDDTSITETDGEESKIDYKQLTLVLTIVDVLTEQVIDKIQLSAKPSLFNFGGTSLHSLLAKPIEVIAKDLTGV